MTLRLFAILLFLACPASVTVAVDYPYANVGPQSASVSVDTSSSAPFNNRLLGLNTNFPENQYGLDGYNDSDGQSLIISWAPYALRFPHGVWANYYDWEVDGRRIYDDYDTIYRGAVENVPQLRYGYDGFKLLHDFLDFDVLHTWNINYDSPSKGVARLLSRRADGFPVERIELGNETFWRNQRSNAVATPALYVNVAQAHAAALKATDSSIQLSVPVTWRTGGTVHGPWNAALAADQSYYDAVSLHRYIRPGEPTVAGLREVLNARTTMIQTGESIRAQFPSKPIWLSEWSVDAGDNAISALGLSDTYLGIIDRPDLFASAEYFQIHNHDPLIIYDKTANPKHVKTTRGAVYDILRGVFLDSQLLPESVSSSQIVSGLDAVTAKAVFKNGDVIIFAINKSPVSATFSVTVNGFTFDGMYEHQALQFNGVDDFPSFDLPESALTLVSSTPGAISLPPLSINVLTLSDPPQPPDYSNLVAGWDTWGEDGPDTWDAAQTNGVTAQATGTPEAGGIFFNFNNVTAANGASADGQYGEAGPATASTSVSRVTDGVTLSNGFDGFIDFTLNNANSIHRELNGFHFDIGGFRPNSANDWRLEILSGGDLTPGTVATGAAPINTGSLQGNVTIDLTQLSDYTLDANGTVTFRLSLTGGGGNAGSPQNGHHLFLDNVGVTEQLVPLPGDFDGDGDVDVADLDKFNGHVGDSATGELEDLDFNADGIVGADDFSEHYTTMVQTSNGITGTFAGDINLDGTVNVLSDAFTLVSNLGNSATSWSQGDLNGDGTVSVLGDAFLLIGNLGRSNSAASDGSSN